MPYVSRIASSLLMRSRLREQSLRKALPTSLANGIEMPRRVTVAVGCGLSTLVTRAGLLGGGGGSSTKSSGTLKPATQLVLVMAGIINRCYFLATAFPM